MTANARVFVAGHNGLVGSAIVRRLERDGASGVLTASRDHLDLRDQAAVNYWFKANRPEYVYLVAGTVGGILANSTRPAEFIYDNMMIHATVVHASHLYRVRKLLYLGSSCIYPRNCEQPMREEHLLSGTLEPTNEAYAIAKIAAVLPDDLRNNVEGIGLIAVPSRDADARHDLAPIRAAIRSEQLVVLDYADVKGEHTRRTVWPIALAFFESSRVLAAWCELRQDFRHFRIDRIIALHKTGQLYPQRRRVLMIQWREIEKIAKRT